QHPGVYLPQGKQGICLRQHFSKGHTQHGNLVGSKISCGFHDGVCTAQLSFGDVRSCEGECFSLSRHGGWWLVYGGQW
ncbi:unnamed protein product, partial [Staurois parvus]